MSRKLPRTIPPRESQHPIFCVGLKEVIDTTPLFDYCAPLIPGQTDEAFARSEQHYKFTRTQLLTAVVGIADTLVGHDDLSYQTCQTYLLKLLPPSKEYLSLIDCVMECARRLARLVPPKTTELLYLRTTHHALYLRITLQNDQ